MLLGCIHANQGRGMEGCNQPGTCSEHGALPEQRGVTGAESVLTQAAAHQN